jgi:hypothetical protein
MKRYQVTQDVHGELREDGHVIPFDLAAGVHTAHDREAELVLEHLEALGIAEPAKAAPRAPRKRKAAAPAAPSTTNEKE